MGLILPTMGCDGSTRFHSLTRALHDLFQFTNIYVSYVTDAVEVTLQLSYALLAHSLSPCTASAAEADIDTSNFRKLYAHATIGDASQMVDQDLDPLLKVRKQNLPLRQTSRNLHPYGHGWGLSRRHSMVMEGRKRRNHTPLKSSLQS